MNTELSAVRIPPRRCGNCRHAARTSVFDGTVVACIVRLEYQCVDRIPDCGHYLPAEAAGEGCGGED